MSLLDGKAAIAYHARMDEPCTAEGCEARGVTVFGGALRCIGHAVPMPVVRT